MIKGSGHVTLDGTKYLLDESAGGHYVHRIPGIFAHDEQLIGAPDKRTARIKRLTWDMSDWSGGEGNRVFYEDYPNVYDYGIGTNPRIPGQLTSRPKRYRATVAISSTDATTRSHYGRFFDGGGKLYYFVDNKIYKATDGAGGLPATWSNVAPSCSADPMIGAKPLTICAACAAKASSLAKPRAIVTSSPPSAGAWRFSSPKPTAVS